MNNYQDEIKINQGYKTAYTIDIRATRRCDYIVDQMELKRKVKILDIGCGYGKYTYIIAKKTKKNIFTKKSQITQILKVQTLLSHGIPVPVIKG